VSKRITDVTAATTSSTSWSSTRSPAVTPQGRGGWWASTSPTSFRSSGRSAREETASAV